MDLFVATTSKGKIAEFKRLLSGVPKLNLIEKVPVDVIESKWSFRENAILKAQANAKALGVNVVAEDSGIIVPALKASSDNLLRMDPAPKVIELPGVLTKRFYTLKFRDQRPLHITGMDEAELDSAKESLANNHKLLELMSDLRGSDRDAYYQVALVVCDPSGNVIFESTGRWDGRIALEAKGDNGFGHDPIFEVASGMTVAQLAPGEKDRASHRGQAIRGLVGFLGTASI